MKPFCNAVKRKCVLRLLAVIFVCGCATSYQKRGFDIMSLDAGYSETQIDQNTFLVAFKGNSITSRQTVESYLFRRCAELTLQSGFDYFVVVNNDTQVINQSSVGGIGPGLISANQSANSVSLFAPTFSYSYGDPEAQARIKMLKGEKPADNVNAFNARDVLRFLAASQGNETPSRNSTSTDAVQSSPTAAAANREVQESKSRTPATAVSSLAPSSATAPTEKKPTTKTYASLVQYDGPKVKSGITLEAEFIDDGSGWGEGRVIYPGNRYVLTGKWNTSTPGKAEAPKLIDQKTLNAMRLLADAPLVSSRFSDNETVLECMHGETALGQRKGECQDNYGNKYHLVLTP